MTAACFPQTGEQAFDEFRQSKDYKLEGRPRHPATITEWFRNALRESWGWACLYGAEHYPEQEAAATKILTLNEKFDFAWPPNICFGVWCELRGRFCEEMRMIR